MRGAYDGKYRKLTDHLLSVDEYSHFMSFDQIEEVLGFSLPQSARDHQAWWANQLKGQSLAWLRAGFKTSGVVVDEERLTFIRLDHPDAEHDEQTGDEPLTITRAKEELAKTFGVEPSQIEITIRG